MECRCTQVPKNSFAKYSPCSPAACRAFSGFKKHFLFAVHMEAKVKLFKLWVLVAIILAGSVCAMAQTAPDLENGFKHWGSYDGSHLDTVNLQNGNLMLHAPLLPNYPQRGKFGLSDLLSFNAKTWQVLCGSIYADGSGFACGWFHGGTGVSLQRSVDLAIQRTDDMYGS